MHYVVYILLVVLFGLITLRLPLVKKSGLSVRETAALFLVKIAATVAFGYLSLHWYGPDSDSWDLNRLGIKENNWLREDARAFWLDLVVDRYQNSFGGLFSLSQSFWNDFNDNLIIKVLALFNFVTRGFYYSNVLFFGFLSFLGSVALFGMFRNWFNQKWLLIAGCFLLPSTLLFSSSIGKDAIAFFAIGILLFHLFKKRQPGQKKWVRVLMIVFSFLLLALFKLHYAILVVPAWLAWWIAQRLSRYRLGAFAAVYGFCLILFFGLPKIFPNIDPPGIVARNQASFAALPKGKTDIALDTLQNNLGSFILIAPQAINHALLRPYITEIKIKSLIPAALELLLYQVLLIIVLIYRVKPAKPDTGIFLITLFLFSFSCLLLTGYISSNLNSIFRYRSLFWPLIITPMLAMIDWKRIWRRR